MASPPFHPDFVSLPQVNPDAPKGGRIVFGESGSFDSLNPFILKGSPPAGLSALTVETLMGRILRRTLHALRSSGRIGRHG